MAHVNCHILKITFLLQCCCIFNANYGGNDNNGGLLFRRKRAGDYYDYDACEKDVTDRCTPICKKLNGGEDYGGDYNNAY